MALTFYDRTGTPVAYSLDDKHIYLFCGRPVAYLHGKHVYDFLGHHRGVFVNGWVRDHAGAAVFLTEAARGGPTRPVRAVRPVKSVRSVRPVKVVREVAPVSAVRSLTWSSNRTWDFFEEGR